MSENAKLVLIDDDYSCLTVEKYVDMGITFFHVSTFEKQSGFMIFKTVGKEDIRHVLDNFPDQEGVEEFINEVV